MNNLEIITGLVQSFIDMDSVGEVTYTPDYIPGNFCLDQPDIHPVKREEDVLGNLLLRRRFSLRIRYFSTLPADSRLENLDDWLAAHAEKPVWLQDFRAEPHVSGIFIHSAKICIEYDTFFRKGEV